MVRSKDWYKIKEAEDMRRVAELERLVITPPPKQQKVIDRITSLMYNKSKLHEITITFKPNLQYTTDITLKQIVKGTLKNILKDTTCNMMCLHEYSDAGLFHYHCMITNASQKILSIIRKQFSLHIGRIEIKPVRYLQSYLVYMSKSVVDIDYDFTLNISIINTYMDDVLTDDEK